MLELHLPYASVQSKIDERTTDLALFLGLGALLFCGALFPSLSRIDLVEFQEVKIDQSFVRCLDEQHEAVVITGIIGLAQALGARVVAEGVESGAVALRLTDLGCDLAQGFYYARPLFAEELKDWLRAERAVSPGHSLRQPTSAHPSPVSTKASSSTKQ